MGGKARDVPVYGSGLFYSGQDPEEAAEAALNHTRRGLSAIKIRVSGTAADRPLVASVADAIGSKTLLAADLNENGSPTTAAWLDGLLSEHGALFLEEPLPARELNAYERLAARSPVAIAFGEHLQGLDEVLPHMRLGSCEIIQPDLTMMGGLTECLKVLRAAEIFGVEVAPHFLPHLFIHLAAVSPSVTWLEDFPLLEPLFHDLSQIDKNGKLQFPSLPGHGLTFADGARKAWLTVS